MIDDKSLDISATKIEQLRQLFPEVISEGKVDFQRLRDILGDDEVVFYKEHYELNWAGKSEARAEIQKQSSATLVPDDEGIAAENCGNIFIEGENLEVLHVLQRSYFGKVKMIYIDPPYNTGNDSFVYPDDYSERQAEYKKRTGITNEEGFLNKQDLWKKNVKESGQFHSVWLSMMYPRLYLARNLLREDGVIFVSIDDNEQANLKQLMDEIFGAENFIDTLIWKKRYGGGAKEKYLISLHEYTLIYAKNETLLDNIYIPLTEESIKRYYKQKDSNFNLRGAYRTHPLEATKSMGERQNLVFDIPAPDGSMVPPKRQWLWGEDRVLEAIKNNEIEFIKDKNNGWSVHTKQYLKDKNGNVRQGKAFSLIDDVYTQHGTNEIIDLFGNAQVFSFPKPTTFIQKLLQIGLNGDKEAIILDFFAGSGSSAHSILKLNEKDHGNRQFICVQMPEPCDETSEAYKAGYRTIANICKARITKVIHKLQTERDTQSDSTATQSLGFNSFKLAPSNFKQWRDDIDASQLIEQLDLHRFSEESDSNNQNMLIELLLKSGRPLTAKVEVKTIDRQELYNVESGDLLVFFDTYSLTIKDYIMQLKPKKVVCLDRVFNNNDEALTNFKLNLKDAGIALQII